jgi:hypothetical protein
VVAEGILTSLDRRDEITKQALLFGTGPRAVILKQSC